MSYINKIGGYHTSNTIQVAQSDKSLDEPLEPYPEDDPDRPPVSHKQAEQLSFIGLASCCVLVSQLRVSKEVVG